MSEQRLGWSGRTGEEGGAGGQRGQRDEVHGDRLICRLFSHLKPKDLQFTVTGEENLKYSPL